MLGSTAAYYGAPTCCLEAFARPLWGLVPYSMSAGTEPWRFLAAIIAEGVDPVSPDYWGRAAGRDPRFVEYGAIGFALLCSRGRIWTALNPRAQACLEAWMMAINGADLIDNNWIFFRLLANAGLVAAGVPASQYDRENDLAQVDRHYRADGWYVDGRYGLQDHYVAMAYHFYSLLLCQDQTLPARWRQVFVERAREFAPQYAAWFSNTGAMIPYGRSLTYRFATAGYWGAMACAGVEALSWGTMKHLYLSNLRWWIDRPVCDAEGLLTLGYGYPNLTPGERYNSPASPYWAFKAFVPLQLPESHPFWASAEESWKAPRTFFQPTARAIVCTNENRTHAWLLTNGDSPSWNIRHGVAKYAKFSYSSHFGFSVPLGGSAPECGGADSTLLLSSDGETWHPRGRLVSRSERPGLLYSAWQPFSGVLVQSWQIPAPDGAVRIHFVETDRPLKSFEGGFCLGIDSPADCRVIPAPYAAIARSRHGGAGICCLSESRDPVVLFPEPNTNLLYPLTALVGLRQLLQPGQHWLLTAVAGDPAEMPDNQFRIWKTSFEVTREPGELKVAVAGQLLCLVTIGKAPADNLLSPTPTLQPELVAAP